MEAVGSTGVQLRQECNYSATGLKSTFLAFFAFWLISCEPYSSNEDEITQEYSETILLSK